MTEYYLEANPPVRTQGRPRRPSFNQPGHPTGGIAVHTAENVMDNVGPDTGAENVANFIRNRTTPGSYHTLVDSDSTILMWNPETTEAFHDATGTNRFSTGLSFATATHFWRRDPSWDDAALNQAAVWVAHTFIPMMHRRGVEVPIMRLTSDEFRAGAPGFVSHAQLDPARRTDPGPKFPWEQFFAKINRLLDPPTPPTPPSIGDDEMIMIRNNDRSSSTFGAVFWLVDGTPVGGNLYNTYKAEGVKLIEISDGAKWTAERGARQKA